MIYHALIECLEDGSTYIQDYNDFYDLLILVDTLGECYRVAMIY